MKSYWEESIDKKEEYDKLNEDIEVDVCVIGGGLTGISTAYYLTKLGMNVAILEKDKICSHTSGHTTGKITSQHGLFYDYLIQSQGQEYAKKYLNANEMAIKEIERIIKEEKIDCDFKKENSYVFTRKDEDVQKIQKEIKATNMIGKESKFKNKIQLPLEIKGAIEFKDQAQFHPIKYAYGLCKAIIQNGGKIYENTKVVDTKLEKNNYWVFTKNNKIKARYIVMATRYPIKIFPGYYFIKMYQSSSYAIVIDTKEELKEGIYISSEAPTISFRIIQEGTKKLLLIVGYDYKTGKQELEDGYRPLEELAYSMYPNCKILNRWISEDCITLDKIPYIGEFSKLLPNMYVATGFNKWGMTSSNIAANIITDEILEKENIYSEIFKATRVEPIKNSEEVKNMLKEAMESIVVKKLKKPNNPTCTHLGCELSYNSTDNTWDCPCHGSRFTFDGKVIEAPAVKDIEIEKES